LPPPSSTHHRAPRSPLPSPPRTRPRAHHATNITIAFDGGSQPAFAIEGVVAVRVASAFAGAFAVRSVVARRSLEALMLRSIAGPEPVDQDAHRQPKRHSRHRCSRPSGKPHPQRKDSGRMSKNHQMGSTPLQAPWIWQTWRSRRGCRWHNLRLSGGASHNNFKPELPSLEARGLVGL
jgi:hypothetical protein